MIVSDFNLFYPTEKIKSSEVFYQSMGSVIEEEELLENIEFLFPDEKPLIISCLNGFPHSLYRVSLRCFYIRL